MNSKEILVGTVWVSKLINRAVRVVDFDTVSVNATRFGPGGDQTPSTWAREEFLEIYRPCSPYLEYKAAANILSEHMDEETDEKTRTEMDWLCDKMTPEEETDDTPDDTVLIDCDPHGFFGPRVSVPKVWSVARREWELAAFEQRKKGDLDGLYTMPIDQKKDGTWTIYFVGLPRVLTPEEAGRVQTAAMRELDSVLEPGLHNAKMSAQDETLRRMEEQVQKTYDLIQRVAEHVRPYKEVKPPREIMREKEQS